MKKITTPVLKIKEAYKITWKSAAEEGHFQKYFRNKTEGRSPGIIKSGIKKAY